MSEGGRHEGEAFVPAGSEAAGAAPALFAYPAAAAFGRTIPKTKIYEHVRPGSRLRQRIVAEVEQIVWKYKLAPETIRLPARPEAPEVQVLEVVLKEPAADGGFPEDILRQIDRAIGFPIIFEVVAPGRDRVRGVAAHKRPSEAEAGRWVLGEYHATPWAAADAPREPLPVALDLGSLYAQLLRRMMPAPPRAGESLRAQAERLEEVRRLGRLRDKLAARLRREKQFNRRVEVNAELRTVQARLDELGR